MCAFCIVRASAGKNNQVLRQIATQDTTHEFLYRKIQTKTRRNHITKILIT